VVPIPAHINQQNRTEHHNMRKPAVAAILAVGAAVAGLVGPAGAITGGEPDGDDHPNVGIVVFYQPDGRFRCSGTLISPTVVLTAAHCTYQDIGAVAVSFDTEIALDQAEADQNVPIACDDTGTTSADFASEVGFSDGLCGLDATTPTAGDPYTGEVDWVTGTPLTHPEYSDFTDLRNWNDTGVIVLDEPITDIAPATLAPENYLDAYEQPVLNHTLFEVVGYGTEVRKNDGGPQLPLPQRYPLIRRQTTSPGQKLDGQILQLNGTINDVRGGGGTCFGDSGGPVFHTDASGTTYVVGDTSYGYTSNCRYLGGYQRVDIPVVRDWLLCTLGDDPVANCPTI
jgi:hypothetical protein